MGYYCEEFKFNGVSCTAYGLEVYDVGSSKQGDTSFAAREIISDTAPSRWKPFFYGTQEKDPLEITISFGIAQTSIDGRTYKTRADMDAIATWLTAHNEYKKLVLKEDETSICFNAICTDLTETSDSGEHSTFEATFTCDSQYGYMENGADFSATFSSSGTSKTISASFAIPDYYKPVIELTGVNGTFSIKNTTDSNREMKFTGVPNSVTSMTIDCDTGIIKSNADINLYEYFNMKFLRLVPGNNVLVLTGNGGTAKIKCAFPRNFGS